MWLAVWSKSAKQKSTDTLPTNFEMCGKRTGPPLLGRFGPNRDTHSLAVVCRGQWCRGAAVRRPKVDEQWTIPADGPIGLPTG